MKQLTLAIVVFMLAQTINSQVFTYRFRDSSVPPPYHRSYEIVVKSGEVHLVVDSYGDVLLDETYDINESSFNNFVDKLKGCHLKQKKETADNEGCTGGTGDSFSVNFGDGKELSGHLYYCAGKSYGDLSGDVSEAKALFKSMVPDFGLKLASTNND